MKSHRILMFSLIIISIVVIGVLSYSHNRSMPSVFNKQQYSLTDPSSIWIIVNKKRPLKPVNYQPIDLTVPRVPLRLTSTDPEMHVRKATALALEQMFNAAKGQGLSLMLGSGYRSYSEQIGIYNNEVISSNQTTADSESARAGYSEHQTGLAADIEPINRNCEFDFCFANTPEGRWLATNAWQFGFVLRYQQGTQSIVGYRYEPWHIRYVGKELSAQIHKANNEPLEQFFSLPPAPDY